MTEKLGKLAGWLSSPAAQPVGDQLASRNSCIESCTHALHALTPPPFLLALFSKTNQRRPGKTTTNENRCGPCKFIHPIYEKMAADNPDVVFAEVDVDEADDVAAKCGIRAMPTFHFYKDGQKIEEMMGADQKKLADIVAKNK